MSFKINSISKSFCGCRTRFEFLIFLVVVVKSSFDLIEIQQTTVSFGDLLSSARGEGKNEKKGKKKKNRRHQIINDDMGTLCAQNVNPLGPTHVASLSNAH